MKTYSIQTIGCQMNERDSETIAGLLEHMGYEEAAEHEAAGVFVINTFFSSSSCKGLSVLLLPRGLPIV